MTIGIIIASKSVDCYIYNLFNGGGELIGITGWRHTPKEFLKTLTVGTLEGSGLCFLLAQSMLRTSFTDFSKGDPANRS